MIFDNLKNVGFYYGINAGLDRAFSFLENGVADMNEEGVTDLGEGVTARCFCYQSQPAGEGLVEGHRAFIDVMFLKEGSEHIGYKNVDEVKNITMEFSEEKDAFLAKDDDITLLPFTQGKIAVFFPHDAHMGGVTTGEPGMVKRVVIKVPV